MNKYGNRKVTEDGVTFDSLAEHRRYGQLKLWQASGGISGLKVHVPLPLEVNDELICVYVADFVYLLGTKTVVEDVKGVRTAVYNLKKKMVKIILGIEITEVEA